MKKILIPIDFSKHSEYAATLASRIVEKTNSEVHLLHLIEIPTGIVDMGAGSNFSIPESMLYIRTIRDKMLRFKGTFFPDPENVKHSIRFQNPFEGIRDYSKKIKADLVIMGSKGHTALDEILIGSNTEKTVRSLNIPVLVTKKDSNDFKFDKMVFASTFEKDEDEALKGFLDFASAFKPEIYFLKINTPQKFQNTTEATQVVERFIAKYNIPKYNISIYNDKSVVEGILNFSDENNIDLVSIATHGRSGLSRFFNGSISLDLSNNVLKPVLTFKI